MCPYFPQALQPVKDPDDETEYMLCKPDANVYYTCLSHMRISVVILKIQNDRDFAFMVTKLPGIMMKPETRDFRPATVASGEALRARVRMLFHALNAAEIKKHSGKSPTLRNTKTLPTFTIPKRSAMLALQASDDDDFEQVWVFCFDPDYAGLFRSFELERVWSVGKSETIVQPKDHLYKNQASEVAE